MKKIIRYMANIFLVLGLVAGGIMLVPDMAQAADVYVHDDSPMIGQGGYIYYIRTSEENGNASIWRMKVATGETSKVVSESGGIIRLIVSGQQLYYTTAGDNNEWEVSSCRLNGDDLQVICDGVVCYADKENVYCIRNVNGSQARLYKQNLVTGKRTSIKTSKKGQAMDYVCNIGSESYYYIYDGATEKLMLYRLHTATGKLTRVATEKRVAEGSNAALFVSDVRQINGELYYDFGSYEGSGSFWYGTIKKLTVDGKKKTVAKLTNDDTIIAGSRELYFTNPSGNNYRYNLKTGKKEKYSLKFEKDISYTVLGDKTYMADTSDKKKITISRFASGTDRETLTRNFITIPFSQKANVNYSVSMKTVGVYNMICVTGRDFTDQTYGWRGKLVSIDWYITDGAGTVQGSFR